MLSPSSLFQGPGAALFTCRLDWLHNLQALAQNENETISGTCLKIIKNFKTTTAEQ